MLCKERTQPALIIKMTNNSIPYEDGAISHFLFHWEKICLKHMPDLWNNLGRTVGVGYLPRLLAIEGGKQRHTRNCVKTCYQQLWTVTKNMCPIVAPLTGRKSPELAIRPYLGWKKFLKLALITLLKKNHLF